MSNIVHLPSRTDGCVFIAHGADGFYVVYTVSDFDPSEIILGGPHVKKSTALAEAGFLASDFGARLVQL